MIRYTNKIIGIIIFLIIIFISEIFLLSSKSTNQKDIQTFARLTNSYNLALSNETIAIRFRIESSINDIFGISPTSREYFHSTFVYKAKN